MENTNNNEITTKLTAAERLAQAMAHVRAKAENKRIEKQIATLESTEGANYSLMAQDSKLLEAYKMHIEEIQGKPVYGGFMFNSGIESVVAIANALQFMKGDLRDQIKPELYEIFTPQIRDSILDAYGRLPYYKETTKLEIDGEMVELDPEAPEQAAKGIRPNVRALNVYFNILSLNLGLLADYEATDEQVNKAWTSAVDAMTKKKALKEYENSINA